MATHTHSTPTRRALFAAAPALALAGGLPVLSKTTVSDEPFSFLRLALKCYYGADGERAVIEAERVGLRFGDLRLVRLPSSPGEKVGLLFPKPGGSGSIKVTADGVSGFSEWVRV